MFEVLHHSIVVFVPYNYDMKTTEKSDTFSSEPRRPASKGTANDPSLLDCEFGRREVHRVAVRAYIFARLAPLEGGVARRRCCERSIVVNLEVIDVKICFTSAKFVRGAG